MPVRYAGCLLAALLLGACGASKDHKPTAPTRPQRLDVTARDFALKINGSAALRPGPVAITARNSGKQAHGMVLVKLNDGVSTPELVSALTTKPASVPNLMTYVGGITTLPQRSSWQATTNFDPGNYAMLDVGSSKAGRLNFTRPGEVQGFTVSGKQVTARATPVSAKVALFDYGITMPRVIPAKGRIQVENTGNDDHELIFLPVKDTAEATRVLKGFKNGKGAATTYRPAEVLAPTSAATSTNVSYQLPKGAYIAYCSSITAASNGRLHAGLGMVAAFAVQ
jgi:hypothetical protein